MTSHDFATLDATLATMTDAEQRAFASDTGCTRYDDAERYGTDTCTIEGTTYAYSRVYVTPAPLLRDKTPADLATLDDVAETEAALALLGF